MAGPKSSPCTERSQADSTHRLVNKLAAFFAARLKPGSRVCVGLSGGLDSVVLLHALNRLVSSTDIPFALTDEIIFESFVEWIHTNLSR